MVLLSPPIRKYLALCVGSVPSALRSPACPRTPGPPQCRSRHQTPKFLSSFKKDFPLHCPAFWISFLVVNSPMASLFLLIVLLPVKTGDRCLLPSLGFSCTIFLESLVPLQTKVNFPSFPHHPSVYPLLFPWELIALRCQGRRIGIGIFCRARCPLIFHPNLLF